jgi:hypothetical protein
MRLLIILITTWTLQSCSTTKKNENKNVVQDSVNSIETINEVAPTTPDTDTLTFLRSVPKDYIVYDIVSDSDVVVFKNKCVVFSNYSVAELADIEKRMTADNYMDFYDDMANYGNEASLFLYEKTKVERVNEKKYIRFIFSNGDELTIDKHKSTETIFFFNPQKGIQQCDTRGFIKEKYVDY